VVFKNNNMSLIFKTKCPRFTIFRFYWSTLGRQEELVQAHTNHMNSVLPEKLKEHIHFENVDLYEKGKQAFTLNNIETQEFREQVMKHFNVNVLPLFAYATTVPCQKVILM
jgi:hypothetical protein